MRLPRRLRKAVRDLLDGKDVRFDGWEVRDALAVIDEALEQCKTLRRHGQVRLEKIERAMAEMRAQRILMEDALREVRTALAEMDENIRILTAKRAELEAHDEGPDRDQGRAGSTAPA